MTGEEAKAALKSKCPVMYNGIEYQYIDAIIYRVDQYRRIVAYVEMFDKCGHSLMVAPMKDVENVQEKDNGNV